MPPPLHCAAIDLGATSGRVITGTWADGQLETAEVHRFPNRIHLVGPHAYWDIPGLWAEVQAGLQRATASLARGETLSSIGVDAWGVDYVLVDPSGRAVYPFHAYRDDRTQPGLAQLRRSRAALIKIYRETGIPAVFYNTSLQLAETVATHPGITATAARCLFLPDYFNFLLTGRMANGHAISGTAQLLNVRTGQWSTTALRHFGIPARWFTPPLPTGASLGQVCGQPGLEQTRLVVVPGHDTTCAYDAIPAAADGSDILISCGTWSLVGCESDQPLLEPEALEARVANDQTGRGDCRPLVNVIGLWLLEETLRDFDSRPTSPEAWQELIREAQARPAFEQLLEVDDPDFANPVSMRAAIDAQLERQGRGPPQDPPGYVRLICDSLGQGHAQVIKQFTRLTGRNFRRIIMVGGGARNALLCQATADAADLPVLACELEGSAVGNLANQFIALGAVQHLAQFRTHLGHQLQSRPYQPRP